MSKRMTLTIGSVVLLAGAALFFKPAAVVHAQYNNPVLTATGTLKTYYTNYGNNGAVVTTTAAFVNPANCSATDGYQTDPTNAAIETSALLAALLSQTNIQLQIDSQGCSALRPMIVGVNLSH